MFTQLLSSWIGRGSAGSNRACDASMVIRSVAVTAAAAAFLVWRLFFGQTTATNSPAKDTDKAHEAGTDINIDSEAASLLCVSPKEDVVAESSGVCDQFSKVDAIQPPATAPDQTTEVPGTDALSGRPTDSEADGVVTVQESMQDSVMPAGQEQCSTSSTSSDAHTAAGQFATELGHLATVHSGFGGSTPSSGTDELSIKSISAEASSQPVPAPVPNHPTYRAQTHRWQSTAAAEEATSATSSTSLLNFDDDADHFSMDDGTPKLRLHVLTGPGAGSSYVSVDAGSVKIGRMAHCELSINDQEVSSKHAVVSFSATEQCWQLADLGSLNGTILNSRVISREGRQRSDRFPLVNRDVLQLGTNTQIRVHCHPSPLRSHKTEAAASQPPNPRNLSPRQQAAAAATPTTVAYPPLRLAAATITRTGLLHVRHGSNCEDVATWRVPFLQASTSAPHSGNSTPGRASDRASSLPHSPRVPSSSVAAAAMDAGHTGLFCVFDGHGGGACSAQARAVVPAAIATEFSQLSPVLAAGGPGAVERAEVWERAYLAADGILSCDEGCTCTTVLAERQQDGSVLVQSANVGDSSAILVRVAHDANRFPQQGPPEVVRLTHDHKVVEPSEQARLRARGFQGKTRLYGLALSRSLGDKFLKEQDVGLLASPHVSPALSISPDEEAVVIIASDGLWDVVTPEAAGAAALRLITGTSGSASAVAEGLMWMALQGRSQDDITVMAIHVHAEH